MGYFCSECNNPVSEERKPCVNCGCERRNSQIVCQENIRLHCKILGKLKSLCKKKPRIEFKNGDDFYRKTKKWNLLDRFIDRENDWYKELIMNEKGEVIRNVSEPLSKHQGHGSAKYFGKRK
jgi:hypothetical protein